MNEAVNLHYRNLALEALAPYSQSFLEQSGLRPGMRVLEVGCGSGAMTPWLAQRVGRSGRVLALDAKAHEIEDIRHLLSVEDANGTVLRRRMRELVEEIPSWLSANDGVPPEYFLCLPMTKEILIRPNSQLASKSPFDKGGFRGICILPSGEIPPRSPLQRGEIPLVENRT